MIAALLLTLGLAACGGPEPDPDPCTEYQRCALDILQGCADPTFGIDCVRYSLEAACGEEPAACLTTPTESQ